MAWQNFITLLHKSNGFVIITYFIDGNFKPQKCWFNSGSMTYFWRLKSFLAGSISSGAATPAKVASSFTFGFYLAIFPVTGTTTLLCVIFSLLFKLNHYIVQGLNFMLIPVHLVLILPFLKAGNYLFLGGRPVVPAQVWQSGLKALNKSAGIQLLESVAAGITVWLILAVLTAPIVYSLIYRMAKFNKAQSAE